MRASLNISLPEELRDWVEEHVLRAGYGSTSEYFRQLVREDRERRVREEIDAKLLAALENGEAVEITPEWRADRRRELSRRIASRKSKR